MNVPTDKAPRGKLLAQTPPPALTSPDRRPPALTHPSHGKRPSPLWSPGQMPLRYPSHNLPISCFKQGIVRYGPPRCPVWCRLVTVPPNQFTTFTRPTGPFLSELAKCQPGNTQNGGTVWCTSDRKSDGRFWIWKPGFLFEFSSSHMFISLSFGDIRVWQTDRRTARAITIAGPHIVAGHLTNFGGSRASYRSDPSGMTACLSWQMWHPKVALLVASVCCIL